MAGRDCRLDNSHPQAWARPLSLPGIRYPDKPEVLVVTRAAQWPRIAVSSRYPAFSLCVLLPHDLPGVFPHVLWEFGCSEKNREPEGANIGRAARALTVCCSPPSERSKANSSSSSRSRIRKGMP